MYSKKKKSNNSSVPKSSASEAAASVVGKKQRRRGSKVADETSAVTDHIEATAGATPPAHKRRRDGADTDTSAVMQNPTEADFESDAALDSVAIARKFDEQITLIANWNKSTPPVTVEQMYDAAVFVFNFADKIEGKDGSIKIVLNALDDFIANAAEHDKERIKNKFAGLVSIICNNLKNTSNDARLAPWLLIDEILNENIVAQRSFFAKPENYIVIYRAFKEAELGSELSKHICSLILHLVNGKDIELAKTHRYRLGKEVLKKVIAEIFDAPVYNSKNSYQLHSIQLTLDYLRNVSDTVKEERAEATDSSEIVASASDDTEMSMPLIDRSEGDELILRVFNGILRWREQFTTPDQIRQFQNEIVEIDGFSAFLSQAFSSDNNEMLRVAIVLMDALIKDNAEARDGLLMDDNRAIEELWGAYKNKSSHCKLALLVLIKIDASIPEFNDGLYGSPDENMFPMLMEMLDSPLTEADKLCLSRFLEKFSKEYREDTELLALSRDDIKKLRDKLAKSNNNERQAALARAGAGAAASISSTSATIFRSASEGVPEGALDRSPTIPGDGDTRWTI